MNNTFDDYPLADGSIVSLCCVNDDVELVLRNWKGETEKLHFKHVIGLEAYGPSNEDLSHGKETISDPLLERSCQIHKESNTEFKCYSIYSAWSDAPLLKIVARSFEYR